MSRAISPVVGTLLLVVITVTVAGVLAATVGSAALGGPVGSNGDAMTDFSRLSAEATAGGEVRLTHEGGEPIDVSEIDITITVDGTPLSEQPPVPFFSTAGFEAGPTGPFNRAAGQTWTTGQSASVTISDSNSPTLTTGDTVVVTVHKDDRQIARASTSVLGDDPD